MTFPQTAHASNPDGALESACDFQNFPNPTLLEAAAIPITRMTTLLKSKIEHVGEINCE